MRFRMLALAYLVASAVGIYVWTAVIPNLPKAPQPPADRDALLWKRGRAVYNTRCTVCHNANPNERGSIGPALRGVSEELLRDRLENGKNGMPPFKDMERHIPALREYLR